MAKNEQEMEELDVKEFTDEELNDDSTDWKAIAQENRKKLVESSIKQRERTKALKTEATEWQTKFKELESSKAKAEQNKPDKPEKKEKKFDYAEKAYLKSSGIGVDNPEEFDWVLQAMEDTGKDIDGVINNKYFQADLKEKRTAKAAKEATPETNRRGGSSSPSKVEYWLQKGELPPDTPDNRKLREEIVETRFEREKGSIGRAA